MSVNEEVCEIALIISSGTDYEFSTAFHFQGFDVKCLLLQAVKRIIKDWWDMVFTPGK